MELKKKKHTNDRQHLEQPSCNIKDEKKKKKKKKHSTALQYKQRNSHTPTETIEAAAANKQTETD
jgi:hypothetical protein